MAELTREDADAFVFKPLTRIAAPVCGGPQPPTATGRPPRSPLVETLMDVVGRDLLRIDRDDGLILDEEGIRDVLAQQVDAVPRRLK